MNLPGDQDYRAAFGQDEQPDTPQPETEEERRQYWERQHEHARRDRDGHP